VTGSKGTLPHRGGNVIKEQQKRTAVAVPLENPYKQ